ncbi:MFS transporter [Yoonia sp.]|uniref:MFS transporter n=1 Tax=Yoonia sp. TaxID=2212373 RepID=UPI0035C7F49D
MATALLVRNRNYRYLFGAGALTNLGDGFIVLALPWLATLMTNNAFLIGMVAAAGRLPWLLFAIPAGVLIDRTDRRILIVRADLLRAGIVIAIMMLALNDQVQGAIWVLAGLAFLLGAAEVLRDNAAQTILPSIVDPEDLEAANGQLWSTEQLTGQFIGPPLAGVLIAAGIAVPFGLHAAFLVLGAGLVWLITLPPHIKRETGFRDALLEGIRFMRGDALLLRLAIVLGVVNFLGMAVMTVQVLLAQDVLGLSAATYGLVLSAGAVGAITGSLLAPRITRILGIQLSLYASMVAWAIGYSAMGLSSHGAVMGAGLFVMMAGAMLWNVITVSWRQRRIPQDLLGRVNSIYRFFGWGSMPLGALGGGLIVTLLEDDLGRELAIRTPILIAAVSCVALLIYAICKLRLD